ncbi:unnamed protein product [Bursaphelenchus xylophilus]|uniref:(pine wood nematode) hypothetical protein n=1 Tax=Bursaphelenchus xylophilus TaxID=6326 RepID=A0A1I7RML9_BURXY|nr:unnamed protein product [Bursaphelenchus xylophilus]CAG9125686.1 unnamed protein product [Bursaphelenchus xylophilus]
MTVDCLVVIGYCVIGYVGVRIASHIWPIVYPYILAPKKDLRKLAGAKWAVITGATDGIGKQFAFELANRGFDQILVSRTLSKLEKTAEEITERYQNTQVKTVVFDFTESDPKAYEEQLISKLEGHEIGVFINNVGQVFEYPDRLADLPGGLKVTADLINVNALSATVLSAFILKQMKSRGNGVLVNVASSAGIATLAYWNVYSSVKKYVIWLTETLRKEYKGCGITIQTLTPFMVDTKMASNFRDARMPKVFLPDAETFAKSAINTIGIVDETTGYIGHQLQKEIISGLLPGWFVDYTSEMFAKEIRGKLMKKDR